MSGTVVSLGSLLLTGTDVFGCKWRTFDPITGWDGSPASSLSLTQKTRAPGGWLGPRQLTPRAVTLTGAVETPSSAALEAALDRLNAAAAIDGATLSVNRGGQARTATVYREGPVDPQWINDRAATWTLDLIAPDPRKYGDPITGSTAMPTKTGGISWPLSWPVTWTGRLVSGVASLFNPGNTPSPVTLTVYGPASGPIIRHDTSGSHLTLSSSYTLAAGSTLVFDTGNRTVLEAGTVSRNPFLTSRQWFTADPGSNDFSFDANVRNTTARVEISFRPAYL